MIQFVVLIDRHILTDRETDGQTDRQTDRQTDARHRQTQGRNIYCVSIASRGKKCRVADV